VDDRGQESLPLALPPPAYVCQMLGIVHRLVVGMQAQSMAMMVDLRTMQPVAELLTSCNMQVRLHALKLLKLVLNKSSVPHRERFDADVKAGGGCSTLVTILRDQYDEGHPMTVEAEAAVDMLVNMLAIGGSSACIHAQRHIEESEGHTVLLDMLRTANRMRDRTALRGNLCIIIRGLCFNNVTMQDFVRAADGIEMLCQCLNDGPALFAERGHPMMAYAARALCLLAKDNDDASQAIAVDDRTDEAIKYMLSTHSSTCAQQAALLLQKLPCFVGRECTFHLMTAMWKLQERIVARGPGDSKLAELERRMEVFNDTFDWMKGHPMELEAQKNCDEIFRIFQIKAQSQSVIPARIQEWVVWRLFGEMLLA
jgi:hypothetical protein